VIARKHSKRVSGGAEQNSCWDYRLAQVHDGRQTRSMKCGRCSPARVRSFLQLGGWLLILALAILSSLLPGCGKNAGPANSSDPTGTYTLATIDGKKLPFTPHLGAPAPEFRSGAITLEADGTFTSKMNYRLPEGKETTRTSTGGYTKEGSSLKLQWKGAGVTTATLEGNTLTIDDEGLRCAYRK
jgi:hypothetical protein